MLLFNGSDAQVITILRKAAADWQGDSPSEFEESHKVYGVRVEYGTTMAEKFREDSDEVRGTLYMPLGSDVLATDQIELQDGTKVKAYGRAWSYSIGIVRGTAIRFRGY